MIAGLALWLRVIVIGAGADGTCDEMVASHRWSVGFRAICWGWAQWYGLEVVVFIVAQQPLVTEIRIMGVVHARVVLEVIWLCGIGYAVVASSHSLRL